MRKSLTPSSLLFFIVACSSSAHLEIPPVPDPPANWSQFSTLKFPNSNCPEIAGVFSEPPVIYQSPEEVRSNSENMTGSYYGHLPFHLADRKEIPDGENSLASNLLSTRQPNADNFIFSFVTDSSQIVEYHFRAKEGDFRCKDGYIEFPVSSSYGMVEGMSVNSQIRNVVLRGNSGALVIQTTTGPYRGDPANQRKKFKHEFLRYPLYERFPKKD